MTQRPTQRAIALFWVPLAATWLMMAVEGPYLAAIIARLPDLKLNLAAHGVAYAFALLVEAPVIMLMSATNALVADGDSLRKLRRFMWALGAGTTAVLLLILIPPVHRWLMLDLIRLPRELADLTYGALWFYLPWSSAIGYRRFTQGVLIRSGRTRLVAYGTVIRVFVMSLTAVLGFAWLDVPGAWVGAMSLSAGVVAEALAARWMAASTVRDLITGKQVFGTAERALTYRQIVAFYYPLALTSLIGLTVQPMLTFFMGRAPSPVESLAVFPVLQALSFLFRSMGLAFQDTAIALMGDKHRYLPEMSRFAVTLGLAVSVGLSLVVFTPLSTVWFEWLSGLTPELASQAVVAARFIAPLPALTVLLSLQRSIVVNVRRTHPITVATTIEVGMIAVTFAVLAWGFDVVGATAAFAAFTVGRVGANTFLAVRCREVVRSTAAAEA